MSQYKCVYNPDVKDIPVRIQDIFLVIPAGGYAIVSGWIGDIIQPLYSTFEITEATLEQYKDYRLAKDKAEIEAKKLSEKAKVIAEAYAKDDAKKSEAKIKLREANEEEARKDALKAKIAVINDEKELIATVEATTVQDSTLTLGSKVAGKAKKKK